jgi:hypothetical protein
VIVEDVEDGELDDEYDETRCYKSSNLLSLRNPSQTMSEIIFTTTLGKDISQQQLIDCTKLFSENYGVWSATAQDHCKFLPPGSVDAQVDRCKSHTICLGSRVKMSTAKLVSQCLPSREDSELVTCTIAGKLVGHAFATTWDYGQGLHPPSFLLHTLIPLPRYSMLDHTARCPQGSTRSWNRHFPSETT